MNGSYTRYKHYDSGPNEGRVDRETYDFDFREGRKIKVRVPEGKALQNCGGIHYGHA